MTVIVMIIWRKRRTWTIPWSGCLCRWGPTFSLPDVFSFSSSGTVPASSTPQNIFFVRKKICLFLMAVSCCIQWFFFPFIWALATKSISLQLLLCLQNCVVLLLVWLYLPLSAVMLQLFYPWYPLRSQVTPPLFLLSAFSTIFVVSSSVDGLSSPAGVFISTSEWEVNLTWARKVSPVLLGILLSNWHFPS